MFNLQLFLNAVLNCNHWFHHICRLQVKTLIVTHYWPDVKSENNLFLMLLTSLFFLPGVAWKGRNEFWSVFVMDANIIYCCPSHCYIFRGLWFKMPPELGFCFPNWSKPKALSILGNALLSHTRCIQNTICWETMNLQVQIILWNVCFALILEDNVHNEHSKHQIPVNTE